MPNKKKQNKLKKTAQKKSLKKAVAKTSKKLKKHTPSKKHTVAKKSVQKTSSKNKKTALKKTHKKSNPKKTAIKTSQKKKTLSKQKKQTASPKTTSRTGKTAKTIKKTTAHKKTTSTKTAVQKNKKSYLTFLEEELKSILKKNKQVVIKNQDGTAYCFEENCDQPASTAGYCRYHYIAYWKQLKIRTRILSENKIQQWVQKFVNCHSPKVLDYMIRDFSNEKDFSSALSEMKISDKSTSSSINEF